MHRLRISVRENQLRDPARVTPAHYAKYVSEPGVSWVAEVDGQIAGFAIADRASRSIWALFVDAMHEGQGIGRALLGQVTEALFSHGNGRINLSTAPGTRAERMYLAAGWRHEGMLPNGEAWLSRSANAADSGPDDAT